MYTSIFFKYSSLLSDYYLSLIKLTFLIIQNS